MEPVKVSFQELLLIIFPSISKFPEFHYGWCCFLNVLALSSVGLLDSSWNLIPFGCQNPVVISVRRQLKGGVESQHLQLPRGDAGDNHNPEFWGITILKNISSTAELRSDLTENNCFKVTHLQWSESQTQHSISSFKQTVASRGVGDLSSGLRGKQARECSILKQITDWS